jgi:hypothetical protein
MPDLGGYASLCPPYGSYWPRLAGSAKRDRPIDVEASRADRQRMNRGADSCRVNSCAITRSCFRITLAISLRKFVRLLPNEMAQQLRDAKFAVIFLISSKGRSTMTRLKVLSMAALLSVAIASPVLATEQEPGEAAFYRSLGVGSHNYPAANAFAFTRNFGLSVAKRHVRRSSRH